MNVAEQIAAAEAAIVAKRAAIEGLTAIHHAAPDAVPRDRLNHWQSALIHATAEFVDVEALEVLRFASHVVHGALYASVGTARIYSTRPVDVAAAIAAINASGGKIGLADALRSTTPACEEARARAAKERAEAARTAI